MNDSTKRYGITLIELLVVLAITSVIMGIAVPMISSSRAASRKLQCAARLRQIGTALSMYCESNGVFPFGGGADNSIAPNQPDRLYSTHSMLLPYLGHQVTYDAINFSLQPFEHDPDGLAKDLALFGSNATAAQTSIGMFLCSADPGARSMDRIGIHPWGHTNMRSGIGSNWIPGRSNGLFGQISSIRPADILDGMAWTASFSERLIGDDQQDTVTPLRDLFFDGHDHKTQIDLESWCRSLIPHSVSLMMDSDSGQNWLRANPNWTFYNHATIPNSRSCKNRGLTRHGVILSGSSLHLGGINALFADGSVRFVQETVDRSVWTAMGTTAGREIVQFQ